MAEDIDHLKYYVGEVKDLLSDNKGEVNHVRRIVHACEPDMEDFTTAMDATHSIYRPREPQSCFAGRVSLNHVSTGAARRLALQMPALGAPEHPPFGYAAPPTRRSEARKLFAAT